MPADALLAEEEAEAQAAQADESKTSKKGKKKKKKKGQGAAGPSQAQEEAAEAEDEDDTVAAAEEVELAAALEESARLEERRAVEEQARVAEPHTGELGESDAPAEPPDDFLCPITTEVMADPVMAADGQSYERSAIERWLTTKSTSPLTGEALEYTGLFPNHSLRRMIRAWQERRNRA